VNTLLQHHEEYLERNRSLNFSACTIRQSRYCGKVFLRWLEACHQITAPERLRARHLHAWQKHLSARTTARGALLKARSVNKHVETLKGFLKYLGDAGLAPKALAETLQYVKEPLFLPGSVLSHEQMRKLLGLVSTDTPDGYRLRTMLEVLYSSGIRVAELLGMNMADVDFKNATARVTGKGRKERVVPVGKTALQYLQNYIRAVRSAAVKDGQEQAVFVDSLGRRFPYYTFRRAVKACARKAGLSIEVTPHTFRRSCTTELLRGGANMYHVKELLGHESLETLKHYAKLTITDLKATHEKCHPREREERGNLH
jgi:integrase/recombinase XerD